MQLLVIRYLPLAHILELIVEVTTMCQGAAIGYAHPRTLTASSPYARPPVYVGTHKHTVFFLKLLLNVYNEMPPRGVPPHHKP